MEPWTEAQTQRLLDLEVVLILVALGVDILIEALSSHDWIAAAVIVAGFCIILGLYWHTLYLDRLIADLRASVGHIFHPLQGSNPQGDFLATQVTDRPVIHVSNFPLSKNFYAQALRPLGYTVTMDLPALSMASLGIGNSSDLWIKGDGAEQKLRASISATERRMVGDFFEAALDAGGIEAEAPGERPSRGANIYAAAVLDPDGYTIEVQYSEPVNALRAA